jgi:hypothetical protein
LGRSDGRHVAKGVATKSHAAGAIAQIPARQVERSSRKIRFVAGRASAERFTISLNLLNNPIWKWQRSHNPSGPALKISHQIPQTGSDDATALVGSQAGTIVASQLSSK